MAVGNQGQIGFLNQIVAALQAGNTIINANGLFVYSPSPGPGNLVVSAAGVAGTDNYGNAYPVGLGVAQGIISASLIQAQALTLNPGPLFLDAPGDIAIAIFTTVGSNNWLAPVGVTSAAVFAQAPGNNGGSGMAGGYGGGGGGGGEFAYEGTLAVTAGNTYHPIIGGGGTGNPTTFAGDAVTVTAHAG